MVSHGIPESIEQMSLVACVPFQKWRLETYGAGVTGTEPAKQWKEIIALYLLYHAWHTESFFGSKENMDVLSNSSRGPSKCSWGWSIHPVQETGEAGLFSLRRLGAGEEPNSTCQYLRTGYGRLPSEVVEISCLRNFQDLSAQSLDWDGFFS